MSSKCSFFATHKIHISSLRPHGLVVQRLTRNSDIYRHEKIIGSIPIVGNFLQLYFLVFENSTQYVQLAVRQIFRRIWDEHGPNLPRLDADKATIVESMYFYSPDQLLLPCSQLCLKSNVTRSADAYLHLARPHRSSTYSSLPSVELVPCLKR